MLKKRETFLPYALPYWDEKELESVQAAIRSNWWSRGPKTGEFEQAFGTFVGAKHTVGMNSCTAALHTALAAKGIGPGDEVITTPMTFCSTANVICHVGATPVFADVLPDTGCIDPAAVAKAVTPRTKAVIPVHYAGQPCDMDAIDAIADAQDLFVLEDAAHAVYTTYKGRMVGAKHTVAFSFYATKNIATGEGGMLATDDEELADRARIFVSHGMSRGAWNRYAKGGTWRYDVEVAGFKYNMTDLQAALGLTQLQRLPFMQNRRETYATLYNDLLRGVQGIRPPVDGGLGRNAWHLYIIRVKEKELDIGRDAFIEELHDYNIGTSVHFIPVHLHPFYRQQYGTREGDFPVAEQIFSEIISLPLYPSMTEEDVRYVAGAVREICARHAK
ncbi:MAG: DegT/DnrJ/EryC1/StrS family aminotransferase [Ethanoligenens sp.]